MHLFPPATIHPFLHVSFVFLGLLFIYLLGYHGCLFLPSVSFPQLQYGSGRRFVFPICAFIFCWHLQFSFFYPYLFLSVRHKSVMGLSCLSDDGGFLRRHDVSLFASVAKRLPGSAFVVQQLATIFTRPA